MKTKAMGVALLTAAALMAGSANARDLSWNYLELGYQKWDGNDFNESEGFDIKGSVGFAGIAHAQLDYLDGDSDGDFDGFNTDGDIDGYKVIAGVHPQLTPNTQAIVDLAWFDYDNDGTFDDGEGPLGFESNTDGFGLGFGLRHSLADNFELLGEVWYTDGDSDIEGSESDFNDTVVELSGRYFFTPNISAGVTVGINGAVGVSNVTSGDVFRLDARWSFGAGDFSDSF